MVTLIDTNIIEAETEYETETYNRVYPASPGIVDTDLSSY